MAAKDKSMHHRNKIRESQKQTLPAKTTYSENLINFMPTMIDGNETM